jgi:hypothetical protein
MLILLMSFDLALLVLDLDRLVHALRRIRAQHGQTLLRARRLVVVRDLCHVRLCAVLVLPQEVQLLASFHLLEEAADDVTHLASHDFMRRHFQVLYRFDDAELFFLAQFIDGSDISRGVEAALLEPFDDFASENVLIHYCYLFLSRVILPQS